MDVYIDAVESRREIVRLYDSANKSRNPQDYTMFQSMGDVAVGKWINDFGSLDTRVIDRQALRQ